MDDQQDVTLPLGSHALGLLRPLALLWVLRGVLAVLVFLTFCPWMYMHAAGSANWAFGYESAAQTERATLADVGGWLLPIIVAAPLVVSLGLTLAFERVPITRRFALVSVALACIIIWATSALGHVLLANSVGGYASTSSSAIGEWNASASVGLTWEAVFAALLSFPAIAAIILVNVRKSATSPSYFGDETSPVPGQVNRWEVVRERSRRFADAAKSKAAETIEAGKVEVKLRQENAAIANRKKELGQLAANCGATALAADQVLEDAGLDSLRHQAMSAKQQMMGGQLQRDESAKELLPLDAKTNPTRVHELKAMIRDLDATVRRDSARFESLRKELGEGILSANLADPRFASSYQQQKEIRREIEERSTSVARLEQDRAVHKKSLGFDVKKVAIGSSIGIVVVVGAFALFSANGKAKLGSGASESGQSTPPAASAPNARTDFLKTATH